MKNMLRIPANDQAILPQNISKKTDKLRTSFNTLDVTRDTSVQSTIADRQNDSFEEASVELALNVSKFPFSNKPQKNYRLKSYEGSRESVFRRYRDKKNIILCSNGIKINIRSVRDKRDKVNTCT